MQFEWDETKRRLNLEKHKIDFEEATTIYDSFVYTFQDTRNEYGEPRFVSLGLLYGVEVAVVFTPRDGKRRIISVRRARMAEREKYHEERSQNEK